MTTNADAERAPVKQEHLRLMYATAQERGCQLQPIPNRPPWYEGVCPFHEAETGKNARTLEINTHNGSFRCNYCKVFGSLAAFMARLWQVTAGDAGLLMDQVDGATAAPERPPYPEGHFTSPNRPGQPRHTAALTRAHAFYAQQLQLAYAPIQFLVDLGIAPQQAAAAGPEYPPIQFLVDLGIDSQQAAAAGLGYAPGIGLPEYLESQGIPAEELAATRLFNPVTDHDIFQGRLTLADLDYADGVQWMTSPSGQGLGRNDPSTGGRPGDLLGILATPQRGAALALTDDFRLYVLLRAEGFAAALLLLRRPSEKQVQNIAQGPRGLLSRHPSRLVIAIHNRQISRQVHDLVTEALGEGKVFTFNRETLLAVLDPQKRNLDLFRHPENYPKIALSDGRRAAARAAANNVEAKAEGKTESKGKKTEAKPAADPETPTEPAAEASPATATEAAIDETPGGNAQLPGVLTDDPSLDNLLRAEGFESVLLPLQQQQDGEQVAAQALTAKGLVQQLKNLHGLSRLVIVMHDPQLPSRIHDLVTEDLGEGKVFTFSRATLRATLDPQQRNLDLFRNPEQCPDTALIDDRHAPDAKPPAAAVNNVEAKAEGKTEAKPGAAPETPTEPAAEASPATAAEAAVDETPVGNDLLQGVLTRRRSRKP